MRIVTAIAALEARYTGLRLGLEARSVVGHALAYGDRILVLRIVTVKGIADRGFRGSPSRPAALPDADIITRITHALRENPPQAGPSLAELVG